MKRSMVLSLTVTVGVVVMVIAPFFGFGARLPAQQQSIAPIVARADQAELLTTYFGTARILAGGDQTNNTFNVMDAVVQPGFEVAVHQHPYDESFYVIDGVMTAQVNGETRRLPAGSYVFIPGGVPHGFVNKETTPLRNLLSTRPAALERAFRNRPINPLAQP